MDNARLFTESNDAGESLDTATAIVGTGGTPLNSISGSLSGDADLFKIFLTGGQTFSATTVSDRTQDIVVDQLLGIPIDVVIDPKIFLFDEQGNGVYANDDLFGSSQSTLPSGSSGFSPAASGIYYLGISGTSYEAVSSGGSIFPGSITDRVVGPTGAGGASPLTGFAGDTSLSFGEYTISLTGAQTIPTATVNPPGNGSFTPNDAGDRLTLTGLNGAGSVRFSFDQVAVGNASAVEIFKVGDDGALTKLDEFSLLRPGQLAAGFAPTFSLNANQGDTLQFRLVENGQDRTATVSVSDNGGATLDFGSGTSLSLTADPAVNAPNLVAASTLLNNDGQQDDGAAIDFSALGGDTSDVTFTVYREASFDSTVGLYAIDDLTGAVTVDGNTFSVGDEGYEAAALQRAINVTLQAENGGVSTFTATVDNLLYGTFISVENPSFSSPATYFSYLGANNGNDHVKLLGNNALGFEDLPGLGDADYNDLVVAFEVV